MVAVTHWDQQGDIVRDTFEAGKTARYDYEHDKSLLCVRDAQRRILASFDFAKVITIEGDH